jgi:hypothetical protein
MKQAALQALLRCKMQQQTNDLGELLKRIVVRCGPKPLLLDLAPDPDDSSHNTSHGGQKSMESKEATNPSKNI